MTLPTLLEDQLTGASDPMAGRIPDTISSGPWGNDPWFAPGTEDDCYVAGFQVQMHGFAGAALFGPLVGNPNNAFVEVPVGTDTFNLTTPVLGVCRNPQLDQGIFAKFAPVEPLDIAMGVSFATYSTPAFKDFVSTPVIPADTSNFTIRLEVVGRTMNAYVDGNLAGTATLLEYPVQGGGCYLESGSAGHFLVFNQPILAGGEYIRPPDPAIGRFSSGMANFMRLFKAG